MTTEQLQKIAWLNRAFHADKKVRALEMKLERDRSLAQRITRNNTGISGTVSGNSTEDALIRLAETERRTQTQLQKLAEIRDEISEAINSVNDDDMQAILTMHFLVYETFDVIAEKMNYSTRNVKYKYKAALDKVCIDLHSEM